MTPHRSRTAGGRGPAEVAQDRPGRRSGRHRIAEPPGDRRACPGPDRRSCTRRPRQQLRADARHRLEHLGRCGTSGPPPTRRAAVQSLVGRRRHAHYSIPRTRPPRAPALRRRRGLRAARRPHRANRLARLERARRPGAHRGGVRAGSAADAVAADRGARRHRLAAGTARRLSRAPRSPRRVDASRGSQTRPRPCPPELRRGGEGHARGRGVSRRTASPLPAPVALAQRRTFAPRALAADRTGAALRGHATARAREGCQLERLRLAPARADGRGARAARRRARGVARPVRLYALAEDGTLVSLPWPSAARRAPTPRAQRSAAAVVAADAAVVRAGGVLLPLLRGRAGSVRYSGFYVDLGGRGLVSTLTMPIEGSGQAGVLALDLTHNVDWDQFAATIAPPLAATIVHVGDGRTGDLGDTAQGLLAGAPGAAPRVPSDDVVDAQDAAAGESRRSPMRSCRDVGAVAAFHVSERAWLLAFFPSVRPVVSGRRDRAARRGAGRAADGIRSEPAQSGARSRSRGAGARREAESAQHDAGAADGRRSEHRRDRVGESGRGVDRHQARGAVRRAHFAATRGRARTTSGRRSRPAKPRRAYGVPIRVETAGGAHRQFAIVRSVAVTAPIEALAADERHRLAILFLVDPQSDLRLLLEDVESARTPTSAAGSPACCRTASTRWPTCSAAAWGQPGQTGVRPRPV